MIMTTTETNPLPRASECDVCGNMYDKAFTVTRGDEVKVFDSFECAIESMAPRCGHCACRVLGHGVESDGQVFCCAHCARQVGEHGLIDRDG
ncbi:hypothetical protein ACIFOC_00211 [Leucobacter aridicollis]|nr:hypothetical protein U746_1629 [Mycolicibacterium mucogenicum 261Sha1.1M5]